MKKIVLLSIIIGLSQAVKAQVSKPDTTTRAKWDRFSIGLGGFLASYNSGITFASKQLGLGVQLNIEDVLGLNTTQISLRGLTNYRFGKHLNHMASLGYFSIKRKSTKVLEKELDINGTLYPIGDKISSTYKLSILRAKYDYAFFQDDRVSLGVSFGLFIMPTSLSVKSGTNLGSKTEFTAPLPLVGLRSDFKITPKFYLLQSAEILYISTPALVGSLLDLNLIVEHKTFKNMAFGAGINTMFLDFNIKNPDSTIELFGDITLSYTGLLVYGKYYF